MLKIASLPLLMIAISMILGGAYLFLWGARSPLLRIPLGLRSRKILAVARNMEERVTGKRGVMKFMLDYSAENLCGSAWVYKNDRTTIFVNPRFLKKRHHFALYRDIVFAHEFGHILDPDIDSSPEETAWLFATALCGKERTVAALEGSPYKSPLKERFIALAQNYDTPA